MAAFIEPVIGVLADTRRRRALLLAGGAAFVLATVLTAGSPGYGLLLFSFILFYPASGAFVNISQIVLMDLQPARREQNMVRWTLAGSLGAAAGPLLLAGSSRFGLGWRGAFAACAALAGLLLASAWQARLPPVRPDDSTGRWRTVLDGARGALQALRQASVLRWGSCC